MKKLRKLVFQCQGRSMPVVSANAEEQLRGQQAHSSHEAPIQRTDLVCRLDYLGNAAPSAWNHTAYTGIGAIGSKAMRLEDELTQAWTEPSPTLLDETEVTSRSVPVTHVQVDDNILVPVEVVHTASQMINDASSMRTLNWAVTHALPVEKVGNQIRGVSFATLPRKEFKRSVTATVQVVPPPTDTVCSLQAVEERKPPPEPADSLMQAVGDSASAIDACAAHNVQQSNDNQATHLHAEKLADIAEEDLPSFMRPTALALSRQRAPVSTEAPPPRRAWHPAGSLRTVDIYSVVGAVAPTTRYNTNRYGTATSSSVALNRAAVLRAVHGRAMRSRFEDANTNPKRNKSSQASTQYKTLLGGSKKNQSHRKPAQSRRGLSPTRSMRSSRSGTRVGRRLAVIPEIKRGLSSLRSEAAVANTAAAVKPGALVRPAVMNKAGSSSNPVVTVQPVPVSSPVVANKLGSLSRLSNLLGKGNSKAAGPKSEPQPSKPSIVVQATNSTAIQTEAHMLSHTATKTPDIIQANTAVELKTDGEKKTGSPEPLEHRLVARLWQGVPSDYVAKNVHL